MRHALSIQPRATLAADAAPAGSLVFRISRCRRRVADHRRNDGCDQISGVSSLFARRSGHRRVLVVYRGLADADERDSLAPAVPWRAAGEQPIPALGHGNLAGRLACATMAIDHRRFRIIFGPSNPRCRARSLHGGANQGRGAAGHSFNADLAACGNGDCRIWRAHAAGDPAVFLAVALAARQGGRISDPDHHGVRHHVERARIAVPAGLLAAAWRRGSVRAA